MYLRPVHAELHIPTLRQFIRDNPLGILTTAIPSTTYPLLQCSHIPWIIDVQDDASDIELGRLRGHMARNNPHSKAMVDALKGEETSNNNNNTTTTQLQQEVMVLFNGPVHHYVTPKFYVHTKPDTGKVVPTWDYSAVQVYGVATVHYDSSSPVTAAYLTKQIADLTAHTEDSVMGQGHGNGNNGTNTNTKAWEVADAPPKYIELLQKAIIGIEIEITRLAGKFKMSQELPVADREGVIEGFQAMGSEEGDRMAETVRRRGELKERERVSKQKEGLTSSKD